MFCWCDFVDTWFDVYFLLLLVMVGLVGFGTCCCFLLAPLCVLAVVLVVALVILSCLWLFIVLWFCLFWVLLVLW